MQKLAKLLLAVTLPWMPIAALAAGSHSGGHGHDDEMAIGRPGAVKEAIRTIEITMKETADGAMVFDPAEIDVKKGETVRLAIKNAGELEHEFVMDGSHEIQEHKTLMEKFPEMEHADPNAVRLQPGQSGEIVWSFTTPGAFEFACLIPGHYQSGMHGPLNVSRN